jgi:hypothetical protein
VMYPPMTDDERTALDALMTRKRDDFNARRRIRPIPEQRD